MEIVHYYCKKTSISIAEIKRLYEGCHVSNSEQRIAVRLNPAYFYFGRRMTRDVCFTIPVMGFERYGKLHYLPFEYVARRKYEKDIFDDVFNNDIKDKVSKQLGFKSLGLCPCRLSLTYGVSLEIDFDYEVELATPPSHLMLYATGSDAITEVVGINHPFMDCFIAGKECFAVFITVEEVERICRHWKGELLQNLEKCTIEALRNPAI